MNQEHPEGQGLELGQSLRESKTLIKCQGDCQF